MDWVINLATTHDFPEQQIHKEYFQVETDTSGDSFEVVAERSGKIIMVEAGETILQALAKGHRDRNVMRARRMWNLHVRCD